MVSVAAVLLGGAYFKRNLLPEVLIGLFIGFSWEITTAPLWDYNLNNLTMFNVEGEELSVEVIFLWGAVLAVSSLMTEFIQKKIFKKVNNTTFFLSGLIIFIAVGWLIEYIGSQYNFWSYSWSFRNFVFGVPAVVLYGWAFASVLYLSTIKIYRDGIRNILRK